MHQLGTEETAAVPLSPPPPMSGALARGTAWTVAIRWGAKFLGIINLAICARILTPADFGLVNMAMVAVGFAMVLFDFGLENALINNQRAERAHYDTAWSLRLLETLAIGLVIMIGAPLIGDLYDDARVSRILAVVGIFVILGGLQNIGVVDLRKELDFRGDFIFNIVPKFVSFLFGVLSVVLFRNYWGLVIAICIHYVARVAMSYFVVDYRPRWSLSRYRELFGFSGWFLLQGLARFVTDQLDRSVIGVLGGAGQVGVYSVAREVGELPVSELAMPMSRALTPVLAKLNETSDRLSAAIEKALGGVTLVAAPVAIGFILVAQEFIQILFGEKWLEAVPIAVIVCFLGLFSSFFTIALNILVVIGRVRQGAILSWIQAVVILAFLYPAYVWRELEGVATLLVVVSAVMAFVVSLYMQHLSLLRGWRTAGNFARPYVAVGCMYIAVTLSQPLIPEQVFLSLMTKAAIGATVYGLAVAGLWLAAGRPDSTEKAIVTMISAQFSRLQWLRLRSLPG